MPGDTTVHRPRSGDPTVEDLLARLRESWQDGRPIPLADLLPPDPRASLIADLACQELDLRIAAADPARAGEYLARFPQVAADDELVRCLLDAEILARKQNGPPPDPAEYAADYPALMPKLAKLLGLVEPQLPSPEGYELLEEIGRGGFGQVFEAEDLRLNRRVAIKFLHPKALARDGVRAQFFAEARSMAALRHDHVVPIYQVGEVDGQPFLVLPLLVGETLAERLKRDGSLPPAEVRRIGRELCLGLSALHAKGLIHRDLKPANLWLEMSTGRVTVLDLGLADEVAKRRGSSTAGTPAYMSPEQVGGLPLDFRSDLFSVGAVLYECATGRRAFPGERLTEVLDAVRRCEPVPVREANPGVPPDLADLITRLLHKDRTARPASAHEVAEALAPAAAPTPTRPPLVRWVVGLAVLLAVLGGAAVVVAVLKPPAVVTVPTTPATPSEPSPPAPLAVDSLQVIPWKVEGDLLKQALPPLGARDHVLPTTANAIEVKVQLSRPAYSYLVLYRSDGADVRLFPQDDATAPQLTDRPTYPSDGSNSRYVLDDGPGIWAVAVLAADTPLPGYGEWKRQHPGQPWVPQPDPSRLGFALLDTGREWWTLGNNHSYGRGEKRFQLEPYQQQIDWLQRQAEGGAVMGVAFPVQPQ